MHTETANFGARDITLTPWEKYYPCMPKAEGMTTRDIDAHIREIYGIGVSDSTVSWITECDACLWV